MRGAGSHLLEVVEAGGLLNADEDGHLTAEDDIELVGVLVTLVEQDPPGRYMRRCAPAVQLEALALRGAGGGARSETLTGPRPISAPRTRTRASLAPDRAARRI